MGKHKQGGSKHKIKATLNPYFGPSHAQLHTAAKRCARPVSTER